MKRPNFLSDTLKRPGAPGTLEKGDAPRKSLKPMKKKNAALPPSGSPKAGKRFSRINHKRY